MKKFTRILALALACMMVLGIAPAMADLYQAPADLYDLFPLDGAPITLTVYSQTANYSGIQTGWSATLLKDLFNVELNIVPDQDGTYETRMASGNLGDIVSWGGNGDEYKKAVSNGMLFDWEEDWGDGSLLELYAPYIAANYTDALESNRDINNSVGVDKVLGYGYSVAFTSGAHQSFMYSWDLRWDLYKQLGYPEINNLDDMVTLFKQMKEICPTDDAGNETYAVSLWPEWDGSMVMYVKALASAYYGYDELALGHYNPQTGEYYPALDEGSPYLEMLAFFNRLYRENLLDPNSMTQTYDNASEKLKNSGTFWSIFNYAGSQAYNTDVHMADGKYMYACVPAEAKPIVYGLGSHGGNRIWSIGAKTEYPELCLAILDWLSTPEGTMTIYYGPRGLMWDYDEEGGMYFTELGAACNKDTKYDLTGVEWVSPYTGKTYTLSGNFNDGKIQINNTTLNIDFVNPDPESKKGETFNKDTWESYVTAVVYDIQQDWRDWSGYTLADQYMEARGTDSYMVAPDVPYAESQKSTELEVEWSQVTNTIKTYSWRCIYAKSEGEFNYHLSEMRKLCGQYGYQDCVDWSKNEAAIKWAMTCDMYDMGE